jgi:hypothetical protein
MAKKSNSTDFSLKYFPIFYYFREKLQTKCTVPILGYETNTAEECYLPNQLVLS